MLSLVNMCFIRVGFLGCRVFLSLLISISSVPGENLKTVVESFRKKMSNQNSQYAQCYRSLISSMGYDG